MIRYGVGLFIVETDQFRTQTAKEKKTNTKKEVKRQSMTTHKIRYDSHLDIQTLDACWLLHCENRAPSSSMLGALTLKSSTFEIEGEHLTVTVKLLFKQTITPAVLHKCVVSQLNLK